jgi:hypothetical protein
MRNVMKGSLKTFLAGKNPYGSFRGIFAKGLKKQSSLLRQWG